MLLALLGVGVGATATATAADHAWAMGHALSFLLPIDAARLVVAILEGDGGARVRDGDTHDDPRARVHWLRYGDAPLAPIDDDMLLEVAAGHACWLALCVLLKDLRAASPPWVTLHDDEITEVTGLYDAGNAWIRRATIAHHGTHYRFGYDVLGAAAARGELAMVQWLLPRTAKVSGQVEPARRETKERFEEFDRTERILEGATRACQFHILQWLVDTLPATQWARTYTTGVEAVWWVMHHVLDHRWRAFFCATRNYGFYWVYARDRACIDGIATVRAETETPLADPLSRDRDVGVLKEVFALPKYPRLLASKVIVLAAKLGLLDVVKWLCSILPKGLYDECFLAAAKAGHLDILEWLHQEHGVPISQHVATEAAKNGHVHVLRWWRSIHPTRDLRSEIWALRSACQYGRLDAAAFFVEEIGTPFQLLQVSDPLAVSPSVETIDFVLDRTEPLPQPDVFLHHAVRTGHVDVVKHLVINRGMWSRQALSVAVACRDPDSALEISQFLYAQAQERARHLNTNVEDQIDLARVTVAALKQHHAVAEWLLQSVSDVRVSTSSITSMNVERGTTQVSRPVLTACIKYRPDECREIAWLPLWAVRTNNFEALELLAQYRHPHVRDADTFQAVTTHARDARFMLKLLPLPEDEPKLRHDVVEWAAKYGMVTVLDRVFDHEANSRIQHQLLKRVVHHMGVSGHIEMADWLVRRCSTVSISTTTVFKDVAMKAVCHGHVHVLRWLRAHHRDHELLPTRPHAIEKLVLEAGNARQVRSLQWLLSDMDTFIQPKWISHVLVDAVRQNHAEVVEFITRTFGRESLSVGSHEVERIRLYLQKIQRGHARGSAIATVTQPTQNATTTSGHRAKRARRQ